ncbi:MAG: TIGR03619 family F420-dependent LLM class oxidoreductase [Acidimicrobiia bacterium]
MTKLSYGIMLPIQSQTTMVRQDWEPTAGPKELAEVAKACDRVGLDFVGVCDHVAIPKDRAAAMSTDWYDTISTLSWIAGFTENVKLMSIVFIAAYRHPMVTAKAWSTLDALSGGRAVLGIGAGHVQAEFEMLGVDFHKRGKLTDEAIVTIKQAFSDEFGTGDFGQRPRPVQPGGPPIWIGGSSTAALKRAARLADGWLPQGPPEQGMAQAIADLHRYRAEAGRGDGPFGVGGGVGFYLGDPGRELPPYIVTAGPEAVAQAVRDQAAIGVTDFQLRIPSRSHTDLIEQLEAFCSDVVPVV